MNRLGVFIILCIISALAIRFFLKSNKPLSSFDIAQCIFDMDNHWACEYQKKISDVIKDSYKISNNSQEVIQKVVQIFPEIHDMKAEICGVDSICFHAYGSKPIFLLQDTKVVVDDASVLEKQKFDQTVVDLLPRIFSQKTDQVAAMVGFIQSMPSNIIQQYGITWHDKNHIVLESKQYAGMRCLISDVLIPNEKIFEKCLLLHTFALEKLPKKKQKKHMVEYDIRFKNQIIVRSGGNYG